MSVPSDRVLRRSEVLWRSTLDGVLVRPPAGDEVVKLTGSGAALWAALLEPIRFDELCAALAVDHDADAAQIAADLSPVIDDLVARRVIEDGAISDGG